LIRPEEHPEPVIKLASTTSKVDFRNTTADEVTVEDRLPDAVGLTVGSRNRVGGNNPEDGEFSKF